VAARLGQLRRDDHGDDWLRGKGSKEGDVAVPLSALGGVGGNARPPAASDMDSSGSCTQQLPFRGN